MPRVLHLMVVCRRGHDVVAEPRLRAPEGKCGSDARPGLPRPHKLLGRFSTDEVERWVRDNQGQPRQQKRAVEHGADAIGAQPQTHHAGKAELTVAGILSLCVAASTCRAATPSGDQTPWRVSEQTDREYQTGIRECILGTGLKVGDDLLTIGFQALGSSVNLIVFRQSDSRQFRAGPSAVPVMLDDQSVLLVEGFATPTTFSGNLRYDGPWNRVFKDMQNSRTMTVHVGRDYTVSLNSFETAYKQWLVLRVSPTHQLILSMPRD